MIASTTSSSTNSSTAGTPTTENRVALVIGNSAYKAVGALPNPRRDAEAIAAALRRVGFKTVTLQDDLTRDKLVESLRSFARDTHGVVHRELVFPGEPVAERFALHVRHCEPEQPVGAFAGIVYRDYMGVLQPRGELDLPAKTLGP